MAEIYGLSYKGSKSGKPAVICATRQAAESIATLHNAQPAQPREKELTDYVIKVITVEEAIDLLMQHDRRIDGRIPDLDDQIEAQRLIAAASVNAAASDATMTVQERRLLLVKVELESAKLTLLKTQRRVARLAAQAAEAEEARRSGKESVPQVQLSEGAESASDQSPAEDQPDGGAASER